MTNPVILIVWDSFLKGPEIIFSVTSVNTIISSSVLGSYINTVFLPKLKQVWLFLMISVFVFSWVWRARAELEKDIILVDICCKRSLLSKLQHWFQSGNLVPKKLTTLSLLMVYRYTGMHSVSTHLPALQPSWHWSLGRWHRHQIWSALWACCLCWRPAWGWMWCCRAWPAEEQTDLGLHTPEGKSQITVWLKNKSILYWKATSYTAESLIKLLIHMFIQN